MITIQVVFICAIIIMIWGLYMFIHDSFSNIPKFKKFYLVKLISIMLLVTCPIWGFTFYLTF